MSKENIENVNEETKDDLEFIEDENIDDVNNEEGQEESGDDDLDFVEEKITIKDIEADAESNKGLSEENIAWIKENYDEYVADAIIDKISKKFKPSVEDVKKQISTVNSEVFKDEEFEMFKKWAGRQKGLAAELNELKSKNISEYKLRLRELRIDMLNSGGVKTPSNYTPGNSSGQKPSVSKGITQQEFSDAMAKLGKDARKGLITKAEKEQKIAELREKRAKIIEKDISSGNWDSKGGYDPRQGIGRR